MNRNIVHVEVISALDEDRLQADTNKIIADQKAKNMYCVDIKLSTTLQGVMSAVTATAMLLFTDKIN